MITPTPKTKLLINSLRPNESGQIRSRDDLSIQRHAITWSTAGVGVTRPISSVPLFS